MRLTWTIVDDFYDDFDAVRRTALNARYESTPGGRYPGRNSCEPLLSDEVRDKLRFIVGSELAWNLQIGSGCFRSTLAGDVTDRDIHFDSSQLSVVVMLNAPEHCSGRTATSFWRHRRTGLRAAPRSPSERGRVASEILAPDSCARDRWELELAVPMVPNRMLLFQSSLFHSPHDQFGDSLASGRLVQVFFLDRTP